MVRSEEDEAERVVRGTEPPASEVMRVARKPSGTFEIDVRAGFERVVRSSVENAMKCYRDAAKARAEGNAAEAHALCHVAELSLDLVHETLAKLEGLES